ncbi:hypothetical protein ACQZV8_02410 [Magnetococcales bacterium HHB-1]
MKIHAVHDASRTPLRIWRALLHHHGHRRIYGMILLLISLFIAYGSGLLWVKKEKVIFLSLENREDFGAFILSGWHHLMQDKKASDRLPNRSQSSSATWAWSVQKRVSQEAPKKQTILLTQAEKNWQGRILSDYTSQEDQKEMKPSWFHAIVQSESQPLFKQGTFVLRSLNTPWQWQQPLIERWFISHGYAMPETNLFAVQSEQDIQIWRQTETQAVWLTRFLREQSVVAGEKSPLIGLKQVLSDQNRVAWDLTVISTATDAFTLPASLLKRWRAFIKGEVSAATLFEPQSLAYLYALAELIAHDYQAQGIVHKLYQTIALERLLFTFENSENQRLKVVGILNQPLTSSPVDGLRAFAYQGSPNKRVEDQLSDYLFADADFLSHYVQSLQKLAKTEDVFKTQEQILAWLEQTLSSEIRYQNASEPLNFIHSALQTLTERFRRNQHYVTRLLSPSKSLRGYLSVGHQSTIDLTVINTHRLPVEILGVRDSDGTVIDLERSQMLAGFQFPAGGEQNRKTFKRFKSQLKFSSSSDTALQVRYRFPGLAQQHQDLAVSWPWMPEKASLKDPVSYDDRSVMQLPSPFQVDQQKKQITIPAGLWPIRDWVVIPPGYHVVFAPGSQIDLQNKSAIISYSPIRAVGTQEKPIRLFSSDRTGQGLVLFSTSEISYLTHVHVSHLSYPKKDNWHLTGAVTFHEAPVEIRHSRFSHNRSEDALNIVRSSFLLTESQFSHILSDALDVDFGQGTVSKSRFHTVKNDGVDFSGSQVTLKQLAFDDIGDKAVSLGEASQAQAVGLKIDHARIGMAVKDSSRAKVTQLDIKNSQIAVAAFRKKSEFTGGHLTIEKMSLQQVEHPYFLEPGSHLMMQGEIQKPNQRNAREKLYPHL